MKDAYLIDSFRNHRVIIELAKRINKLAENLPQKLKIMEVCGGHTHTIMKYGLNQLLSTEIELIHGPGCPVCVMPKERIDEAYEIAMQEGVILVTLGDMIKVPGSKGTLQRARAEGRDVRFVYSPLEVLKIAKEHKDKKIVYFAIGFETTTPMSAALLERVMGEKLTNVLFHINHVCVPEPLELILGSEDSKINALLAPSHVSVITGAKIYVPLVERFKIPVVVAGFEPIDVMESILRIVAQKVSHEARLEIEYARSVSMEGNLKAQALCTRYFTKRESFNWRGLGAIPRSALKLKEEFREWDAECYFADIFQKKPAKDHPACRCGDILKGIAKPFDCKVFAKACTPQNPLGSCMVSSEGACAAYYKYGQHLT